MPVPGNDHAEENHITNDDQRVALADLIETIAHVTTTLPSILVTETLKEHPVCIMAHLSIVMGMLDEACIEVVKTLTPEQNAAIAEMLAIADDEFERFINRNNN
jgi:hypothetical protein